MMYGVVFERPVADEPMTTGKSGKMHGARTVRSPAMNETARSAIALLYRVFCRKIFKRDNVGGVSEGDGARF